MAQPRAIVEGVRSLKSGVGASLVKGRVVKLKAAAQDTFDKIAAATDAHCGVLMQDSVDGQWCDVQVRGKAIAIAGTGGVSRGDRLTVEAGAGNEGRVVTAAPAGGANVAHIGIAVTTAAAAAEVEVELTGPGAIMQGA